MTITTHAGEAWVSALSTALDRPIEWDGTGECTLEFKDGIDITFTASPQTSIMVAHAAVTHEEQPLVPGALRLALTLNHAQLPPGFTLALDDDSGQFALMAVLHERQAQAQDLLDLLEGFIALVPQLRTLLIEPAMPQNGAMQLAHTGY